MSFGLPASYRRAALLVPLGALLVCALAFPHGMAGGAALIVLVALAGAGVVWLRERVSFELPRWAPDVITVVIVTGASVALFAGTWNHPGLRNYDWGPHHANLKNLVDALQQGSGVPRWVHGVSTGDSPYELYPLLPYWLMARSALLFGISDLTLVLVRTAVLTHTLAAVGGALLARRVLSWPWGVLVGLVMVFDWGSVWGGGIEGLFKLGVLHAALGNAVFPFVLVAVVDWLRRPSLATAVRIWASVLLALACHPLPLLTALATVAGLVLVALAARDVPAHRPLFAAFHLLVGVALAAPIFMPLNARLLTYGVHFSLAGQRAWEHFAHLLKAAVPETTWSWLVFAGYLGVAAALSSRRALPMLLGAVAGVLLLGLLDQPYVLLDALPSLEGSRFQTTRLASAAKASLYVLGAYTVASVMRHVRSPRRHHGRFIVGAVLAVLVAAVLRGGVPYVDRLSADLRNLTQMMIPDEDGMQALSEWARAQQRAQTPQRFGRLLHEDDRRFYSVYHVNALSGLPTLWVGPVSCLFLRERIEDASPASLRRFDVRWVMRRDEPPSLGEPATEQRFGRYFVRELGTWDGRFARIERGAGDAVVTRLENERIDVDLRDTTEPALVALGMGYYPRWQATHEKLGLLPVYAHPTVPGGKLSVPAAWLPPGRTTFRPSGALPSDGKGRFIAFFAALIATGSVVVARHTPARRALLRRLALGLRALRRRRADVTLAAWVALGLVLLGAGLASARSTATALELGSALWGTATVEARTANGAFRECAYSAWYGAYRCPRGLLVQDSVVDLLEDAPPSPPFSVPAIVVSATNRDTEVKIRFSARLAGEYWATATGTTRLTTPEGSHVLDGTQRTLRFEPRAEPRELTLQTSVAAGQSVRIAVARRDRLDPERGYLRAPATAPH